MSPNGEIYFRKELYRSDYSSPIVGIALQHTFIHELAHVWQSQQGMWVRSRGLFSWAANYSYILDEKKKLTDYSLEQQAQIIADYWLLMRFGFNEWNFQRIPGRLVTFRKIIDRQQILPLYQSTLSGFMPIR
ncbi:Type IV secretion protein Rhs [Paramixta manurensis]|uniref:Type IV secretion protein Rhs n=1 Tax=Paramixta manurensis TaxID=2740817 RepID=A0A6M8UJ60_9GAMM|nr:Type IV secretion protein Rhs [Erwiniaceae bacterium PD-1]